MAIEVISKIKQKNNGEFPLMDAKDVELNDGRSVEEALQYIEASMDYDNDGKISGLDNIKEVGIYNVKMNLIQNSTVLQTIPVLLMVLVSNEEEILHMQILDSVILFGSSLYCRTENPDNTWGEWNIEDVSGIEDLNNRITTIKNTLSSHQTAIEAIGLELRNITAITDEEINQICV